MTNRQSKGMSGNKGEWSELYTFLKLLSEGRVYAANEKVEKIVDLYYPILKIKREENKGELIEYVIKDSNVIIECWTGDKFTVSRDLLDENAVKHFFEKEKPDWVILAAAKVGGIMANST